MYMLIRNNMNISIVNSYKNDLLCSDICLFYRSTNNKLTKLIPKKYRKKYSHCHLFHCEIESDIRCDDCRKYFK